MNNRKITRRSVNSLNSRPITFPPPVPLDRRHSSNSIKDKRKPSNDLGHPGTKTRAQRRLSEDQEFAYDPSEHSFSQTNPDTPQAAGQQGSRHTRNQQNVKPPKPYKFQDVNLEIPKPIRLFPFEQSGLIIRNEFQLGPNLLKHRHIKIVHRDVCENNGERFVFYNAFIAKKNKNDFTQIAIEYFDEKLNQNRELSTLLDLENQKDRSFILMQDIGFIELDQSKFEFLFNRVDPSELSFDLMKTKNNLVYWPVVVMNNCAVDSKTREFLSMEIEDDCDFLREYIMEPMLDDTIKMEDGHDKIVTKKEALSIFGDDQESDGVQALGREDLLRVREELKEIFTDEEDEDDSYEEEKYEYSHGNQKKKENQQGNQDVENIFGSEGAKEDSGSLGFLEEDLQKEKSPKKNNQGKRPFEELEQTRTKKKSVEKEKQEVKKEDGSCEESDGSVLFPDLPIKKKVKTEEDQIQLKNEKIEDEVYSQHIIHELEEVGSVLIWLVGTGYYQLRKIHEIKQINNENKAHMVSIAKKSKYLNRMLSHFAKLVKNYNISTQDSDYSLPISNKVMKENLLRVVYLGTEDRALTPMIPLNIKEKKNENFTVLRVLDDFSLLMVKNNDSKTVVKASSFLPPLDPIGFERLDNLTISQNYSRDFFIKKIIFPSLYPRNLIDVNYHSLRVAHKRNLPHKHTMAVEDPAITRSIRCRQCNYILGDLAYHKCNKCEEYFHDHCVSEKKHNSNSDPAKGGAKSEKRHSGTWVCKSCKNCSYCAGGNNKEYLVFCNNCDEGYHTFCIQALHHNYRIEGDLKSSKFVCTECALCQMCGCEINNFSDRNIAEEEGLTLCDDCLEIRLKKEYCPICNKRWEYQQNVANKEEIEMIECQCKMWVHKNCDPELTKDLFKEFSQTGRVYHCPNCRRTHKNKQLVDFINVLIDLDENKYFTLPVDEKAAPNYRQVISHPMDFETMTKKAMNSEYLDDAYNLVK